MNPAQVEEVFRGQLLRVTIERWDSPERTREIVRHPGASAVLATTPEGNVLLVRQLREAVRSSLLEVPAGLVDPGDGDPSETARRELREETGFEAYELKHVARMHSSPGFTDESVELFLARARRAGDPEEELELVEMSLDDALEQVESGAITDAKTMTLVLLASRRSG